ncbi:MAG: penicillin-binding protein 1C, partial [Desulfobacterales bacterium]|nr:penicillin-binding protein 1C [Desulfobacterales bacterium]
MAIQRDIEALVERYVQRNRPKGVNNAAAMLVDSRSMEIISMVGSADYYDASIQGQVNGTLALRSPGSTLKPFIYALAMEQGLIHPRTTLLDAPTSFSEYSPDNYQSDFHGPIPAGDALITSRNVPAVDLASKISKPDLYDFLLDAGIELPFDREHYGLSIVLGGAELSMENLALLYGALANQGYAAPLKDLVEDREASSGGKRILSSQSAYLSLEMLRENPRPSYSSVPYAKDIASPVAYKTGTSIGFKDCWSVGIFDHWIALVWLGNFDGYGNPAFNGRYMASPLLFEIVDLIRNSHPMPDPPKLPEGIRMIEVCA